MSAEGSGGSGGDSGSNVVSMSPRGSGLEKFLLVPQVAERLGVSPSHIYRLSAVGALKPTRLGRSVRFRPSDVEAWIAEQHAADQRRREEIERRREAILNNRPKREE